MGKRIDVGIVKLSPTSDEDEDYEEVQHGLFLVVLWAPFEGDVTVNN